MISTNKLYDVDIIDEIEEEYDGRKSPGKKSSKKDFLGWIHQFNERGNKNIDRRGKRFSGTGPGLIKEGVFSDSATQLPLENILHMTQETK